jgi:nitrogen fixation protein NifB
MGIDISLHPCFNPSVRHRHGRIHLPVAPECNVQCGFCNRRYDCVNESRPGVTSAILTPRQAVEYVKLALDTRPEISVVGIAGPGDPFATPEKTIETLALVRNHFPEMVLCVASNGMQVARYAAQLADLEVSHVTITVNALDPEIGAKVYRWFRDGTRVLRGTAGAAVLIQRQLEAITALKEHGVIVKVNSILLPGINLDHIETVARKMAELHVDIFNCMPMLPAPGSDFENLAEPDGATVTQIRAKAAQYIPQMHHCTRCRADAAGLLGEAHSEALDALLRGCCTKAHEDRSAVAKRIAVATMEGVMVNEHLGSATQLSIFENSENGPVFIEHRETPPAGGGDSRWNALAGVLHDCHTVLVQFAGKTPREILKENGLEVLIMEGLITPALEELFAGRPLPEYMTCRAPSRCGEACSGNGGGCGA